MALKKDYSILITKNVPPTNKDILELAGAADAFCPVFTDRVDRTLIEGLPENIKIIASLGAGVDHIDLKAAKKKGIVVTNTPDVLSDDTADLTIGLILSVMRSFYRGEKLLRGGLWKGASISGLLGRKVTGKTLGIIGMGRIGEKVAIRARAFDMKILYFSRTRKPDLEKKLGMTFIPLKKLLAESDVVTLHCDLNEKTRHLIDGDALAGMKKGSFLINAGRGGLIDEGALVEALQEGPLAGAGLDVYEFEPKLAAGLITLENVTLLPHLGSATYETRTAMGLRVKANLDRFFATGSAPDPV